jgi:trehalose 6-phosphate phosphatase
VSAAIDMTPRELAELIRPLLPTGLLAFDVDGVLAPIVEHADDATLTPGVGDHLASLTASTCVAILSGRALQSLERLFAFPPEIHVIGSHGLEARGSRPPDLDDDERFVFEQLEIIGGRAVDAAGDGAWLEYKPASVVLHTRSADRIRAAPAVEAVSNLASMITGAQVKAGSSVVEMLARRASKGEALSGLAAAIDRTPIVYFGDDVTDEDAFRAMGDDDVSVRVGPGATAAAYRLPDPAAVSELIALLAGFSA